MTILSRPQEADLLTFEENHPAYINPVLASAEFVSKVSRHYVLYDS
jgi:hypothetical protein